MQLQNRRVEGSRKVRYPRRLVGGHRDDHVVRYKTSTGSLDDVLPSLAPYSTDANACEYWQVEVLRVCLEVICHLVFAWEARRRRRKWKPNQTVVFGRREQAHRIPSFAPLVPHTWIRFENHERQPM